MPQSSPDVTPTEPGDYAECREAIRQGSKTFFAASMVLQVAMAMTDTKTMRGVLDCIGIKGYLYNVA
jgi:hypothetical protein